MRADRSPAFAAIIWIPRGARLIVRQHTKARALGQGEGKARAVGLSTGRGRSPKTSDPERGEHFGIADAIVFDAQGSDLRCSRDGGKMMRKIDSRSAALAADDFERKLPVEESGVNASRLRIQVNLSSSGLSTFTKADQGDEIPDRDEIQVGRQTEKL